MLQSFRPAMVAKFVHAVNIYLSARSLPGSSNGHHHLRFAQANSATDALLATGLPIIHAPSAIIITDMIRSGQKYWSTCSCISIWFLLHNFSNSYFVGCISYSLEQYSHSIVSGKLIYEKLLF